MVGEEEYTKGEWKAGKLPPLSNWVVGVDLDNPMEIDIVANLYLNEANANLIASAPDLYEALKRICIWLDTLSTSDLQEARDTARVSRKAIAKAEGK